MRICFFGTYNRNYARNSSLREGLRVCGADVIEVNQEPPNERMELPQDYTFKTTVYRVWRKFVIYVKLIRQLPQVVASDFVFVLHPGHLDLPLAFLVTRLIGKPLIFDTSISPYDTMFIGRSIAQRHSYKARLVKFIEGALLRLPDRLYTDTKLMKQFIASEFGINSKKIFVVPLGANDVIYQPGEKLKAGVKNVHVFFFGLYNPLHGVAYILEAAKRLKADKNLKFNLLGDGYLKPELIRFAQKNKLTNVIFTGFVPEEKLVTYIQKADILLGVFSNSPVFQRAIPNKVFAALACKKPLITAKLPPVAEYLTHGENVYFCESENPASLAQAIAALARDAKLRHKLADQGYALYLKRFTPKVIGQTLIQELSL